jgi:hypothetical protein
MMTYSIIEVLFRRLFFAIPACCIICGWAVPAPNCSHTLYGVEVPGFVAKSDDFYQSSEIAQCGGMFTWRNCFNGNTVTSRNGMCITQYLGQTQDVYYTESPYSQPITYICVLPSRRLPCQATDSLTGAKRHGLTMWQSLATSPCSAECDVATKKYTLPGSGLAVPGDCNTCIDCEPNCPNILIGKVLGPEICCIGVGSGSPPPKAVCSECADQPPAPVCGSDGNTYITACLAACQNVSVASQEPCAGRSSHVTLLDQLITRHMYLSVVMMDGWASLSSLLVRLSVWVCMVRQF